jgi:CRISPR-associated protein Cmr1
MHRVEAEFEVVTPMFLGGADPKAGAELRGASLKGALRFWWRALAWGRLGDLAEIHKQEMKLFGSADRAVGQASFSLAAAWVNQAPLLVAPPARDDKSALPNVAQEERRRLKRKHRLTLDGSRDANAQAVGPGARYLGFGLTEAFGRTQRSDPRDRQSPVIDVFVPPSCRDPVYSTRMRLANQPLSAS